MFFRNSNCYLPQNCHMIQYSLCCCLVAQLRLFTTSMDCSQPGSSVHGISPGKNTGVGCYFLLQGIFLTQGSNQCLPHWQEDSLLLSHLESSTEVKRLYLKQQNMITAELKPELRSLIVCLRSSAGSCCKLKNK